MFIPCNDRYKKMEYNRVGNSGLLLPKISLGLWLNFGDYDDYDNMKAIIYEAFNNGITHFDLANNYGPNPGAAERNFGKILKEGLIEYRDELIISTKAGYAMWDGPYGDGGSRKYLFASLNQSLKRLGLDYVDIFYHHRYDYNTPIRETMLALRDIVLMGKALYVGLSNYNGVQLMEAVSILEELNVPYVISQSRYSMLDRTIENNGVIDASKKLGKGIIAFSPLAQGRLSNKYIDSIPNDSRAMKEHINFLNKKDITEELLDTLKKLKVIADKRGQTISQMALVWDLQNVSSVLIGVSKVSQLKENIDALKNSSFTEEELEEINKILK